VTTTLPENTADTTASGGLDKVMADARMLSAEVERLNEELRKATEQEKDLKPVATKVTEAPAGYEPARKKAEPLVKDLRESLRKAGEKLKAIIKDDVEQKLDAHWKALRDRARYLGPEIEKATGLVPIDWHCKETPAVNKAIPELEHAVNATQWDLERKRRELEELVSEPANLPKRVDNLGKRVQEVDKKACEGNDEEAQQGYLLWKLADWEAQDAQIWLGVKDREDYRKKLVDAWDAVISAGTCRRTAANSLSAGKQRLTALNAEATEIKDNPMAWLLRRLENESPPTPTTTTTPTPTYSAPATESGSANTGAPAQRPDTAAPG